DLVGEAFVDPEALSAYVIQAERPGPQGYAENGRRRRQRERVSFQIPASSPAAIIPRGVWPRVRSLPREPRAPTSPTWLGVPGIPRPGVGGGGRRQGRRGPVGCSTAPGRGSPLRPRSTTSDAKG